MNKIKFTSISTKDSVKYHFNVYYNQVLIQKMTQNNNMFSVKRTKLNVVRFFLF